MKKEYKFTVIILLIITILSSNFIWYKLFTSEKEKLKHAIIPSLKDDYFTNQLILSKGGNNYSIYEYEDLLDKYYSNLQYSFITKNFPLVKQNPDYPNGCEVASATMLLNYAGIDIDMETYVDKFLPKEDVYEKNGVRYGPDPSEYYAGDPSDPKRGWGTFLPVIKNSIYSIFKEMLPEDTAGHVFTSNDKRPLEEMFKVGTLFLCGQQPITPKLKKFMNGLVTINLKPIHIPKMHMLL